MGTVETIYARSRKEFRRLNKKINTKKTCVANTRIEKEKNAASAVVLLF